MNFRKNLDFNKRLVLNIKTENKKITNEIRLFWHINNKNYEENVYHELDEKFSKFYEIEFNNGIKKESLIKIKSRFELIRCLNLFKNKLDEEYNIFESSKEKEKIIFLDDISTLFYKRLKEDNSFERNLLESSRNEEKIRKLFFNPDKKNFNHLLAISTLNSKEKIIQFLSSKGLNWKSLNKLTKLGFLWIKRDFNNKILDFIMNESLRNRLINYVENEGIDIYNLEFL